MRRTLLVSYFANAVNLTSRTMFEYDTHQNIPWNFLEYSPEKEYLDPQRQVLMRKYTSQTECPEPCTELAKCVAAINRLQWIAVQHFVYLTNMNSLELNNT